jgi:beta-glucosidase
VSLPGSPQRLPGFNSFSTPCENGFDEIVQLYIRGQVSSVTRPVNELKGFERILLAPGQSKTVSFPVTPDKLSFLNQNMERVVEPGLFDIMVGPSSTMFHAVTLEVLR